MIFYFNVGMANCLIFKEVVVVLFYLCLFSILFQHLNIIEDLTIMLIIIESNKYVATE